MNECEHLCRIEELGRQKFKESGVFESPDK